jgi:NodT family efflux transporter outer membrane factor (OMF) lipoprotein
LRIGDTALNRLTATRTIIAGVFCLPLALVGCSVGPNYHPPAEILPQSFSSAQDIVPTTRPASATQPARPVDLARWWQSLDDPQLNSLVQKAIASNYDLRVATTRLQEARSTEAAITGGVVPGVGYLPGADVSAAAGRGSGTNTTKGRIAAPLNAASNTTGLKEITQIIGFDAGWEVDLFGHYRRLVEASQADTQAQLAARNEVLVSVVADVVRNYISVRALQYRLQVARQNAATEQRTLELVKLRVQGKISPQLDLALAQRQLSVTLSLIAPLESQLQSAKRRVAVLVGLFPDQLERELQQSVMLPSPPPSVAAGMPLELLRRRPDIRRAERQLAASTARIGMATADLFPRISVTAGAGIQGQGLGREPEKDRYIYSVGPALYWPFLDFGRLDAMIQLQDFQTQENLLNFQRTIITAVAEVDDALDNYAADQDSLTQLGQAVTASQQAEQLATLLYRNGASDFLNVLDAERQLFALQDRYAVAEHAVIVDFIGLYKALGGGWEGYEAVPSPLPPRPALLAAFENDRQRMGQADQNIADPPQRP